MRSEAKGTEHGNTYSECFRIHAILDQRDAVRQALTIQVRVLYGDSVLELMS